MLYCTYVCRYTWGEMWHTFMFYSRPVTHSCPRQRTVVSSLQARVTAHLPMHVLYVHDMNEWIPRLQPFQLPPPIHLHSHLDQVGRACKELTSSAGQHATRKAFPECAHTQATALVSNTCHAPTTTQFNNAANCTIRERSRPDPSPVRHPSETHRRPFLMNTLQTTEKATYNTWHRHPNATRH